MYFSPFWDAGNKPNKQKCEIAFFARCWLTRESIRNDKHRLSNRSQRTPQSIIPQRILMKNSTQKRPNDCDKTTKGGVISSRFFFVNSKRM